MGDPYLHDGCRRHRFDPTTQLAVPTSGRRGAVVRISWDGGGAAPDPEAITGRNSTSLAVATGQRSRLAARRVGPLLLGEAAGNDEAAALAKFL